MLTADPTQVAAILRKALSLIHGSPQRWTQHAYWRDASGSKDAYEHDAVCFCPEGALLVASRGYSAEVFADGTVALCAACGYRNSTEWNDAPERAYLDVIDMLLRAIRLIESGVVDVTQRYHAAQNYTQQQLDAVKLAVEDWQGSHGGARLVNARWGLECFRGWRFARQFEQEAWLRLVRAKVGGTDGHDDITAQPERDDATGV